MKKSKKKIIITIFITAILLLGMNKNYAANQTNSTNSNTVKTQNTSNTTTTKETGSSDTMLTSLGIKPYDFTGFKNAKTTYDVKVPENIKSVEVYATTKDKKATLEGTGTKTLEMGKNVAEVTVIAENGTRKTFTINITRGEETAENNNEEKIQTNNENTNETDTTTNNEEKNKGLQNITIEGVTLSPEFESSIYEYTGKYIGEATQLEIEAQPINSNYIVEVIGNNNLVEGENLITILVSESNGTNVATYQITVNKSLVDEEKIEEQNKLEEERKSYQKNFVVMGTVFAILIVTIVIYMIIKHANSDDYGDSDYESYGDDYEDDNDEIYYKERKSKNSPKGKRFKE